MSMHIVPSLGADFVPLGDGRHLLGSEKVVIEKRNLGAEAFIRERQFTVWRLSVLHRLVFVRPLVWVFHPQGVSTLRVDGSVACTNHGEDFCIGAPAVRAGIVWRGLLRCG